MKASALSKKSSRPSAGKFVEHQSERDGGGACPFKSSVRRRPIWFNTSRISGLVREMSEGGTTKVEGRRLLRPDQVVDPPSRNAGSHGQRRDRGRGPGRTWLSTERPSVHCRTCSTVSARGRGRMTRMRSGLAQVARFHHGLERLFRPGGAGRIGTPRLRPGSYRVRRRAHAGSHRPAVSARSFPMVAFFSSEPSGSTSTSATFWTSRTSHSPRRTSSNGL